jgi:hypothetical protein
MNVKRKPKPPVDPALRHFDEAASRAEDNLYRARDLVDELQTRDDPQDRRELVSDLFEAMMDASYELGKAEAYLRQAGRSDPYKVPRYRQITQLFADVLNGARAQRVANLTDRGRAAFASGMVAAAGAILGGVVLGPAGAVAGSIAGGAIGPYAFMRDMRDPDDLGDAVMGGGVGGIFSPIGAALGAYLAGDELERRSNPEPAEKPAALKRRLTEI